MSKEFTFCGFVNRERASGLLVPIVVPDDAHRDNEGEWRAVSGTCTYSGCTLTWNGAGESWDCPCDGSRYTIDGMVFDGPAQDDLRRRPVSVFGG